MPAKKPSGGSQSANFNIGSDFNNKIIDRAKVMADEDGWPKPNNSAVVREALECYFYVLDLFGDDWRGSLKIQSKPKWAKELEKSIFEKLNNLSVVGAETQKPLSDNDIDFDGMFE